MNGNIYLLIRAQEGMQLFMAKVIHLNFLEGQAYVNSPIENKLTGPFKNWSQRIFCFKRHSLLNL